MKHRNRVIGLLALGVSILPLNAHAFSGIVFDPTNYRQNLITAIRTVQQVNNQISQLNNEVQMLRNQAEDLASLPFSVRGDIDAKLRQIEGLIASANSIAFTVSEMDAQYRLHFPDDYRILTNTETITKAQEQWQMTKKAYHDALLIQAEVKGFVATDRAALDRLVSESQSAIGNLQAAQAGNQLVALQTKQMMQHQLLIASQYRAEALDRAQAQEARERSKARFSNFLSTRTAYTP